MGRVSACAVAVCLVVAAAPALGAWDFWEVRTATAAYAGIEIPLYMPDEVSLVPEGCLVQFIVALDESEIVDPLEYFDYDDSGAVEFNSSEYADAVAWMNAGADPAEISGGMNVLTTASNWDGTTTLSSPGHFVVDAVSTVGDPYHIVPGDTFDKIAYRVWSLSPAEMAALLGGNDQQIWYLSGRELTSHDNWGGGPDTGWWIGMPSGAPPEDWAGFSSLIGWELVNGLRDKYALNSCLGTIPEPGVLGFVGAAVLGMLRRRVRSGRARRREIAHE